MRCRFGIASRLFLLAENGWRSRRKEEGESKRKALSRDRCQVSVCTSFFLETWRSCRETCSRGMAEISYFWHEITRFMATTVGRDERRRVHATARSAAPAGRKARSEEHTSELQSLMRISYAVFCLKKKKNTNN